MFKKNIFLNSDFFMKAYFWVFSSDFYSQNLDAAAWRLAFFAECKVVNNIKSLIPSGL